MENIKIFYVSLDNATEGVSKLSDLRDHRQQY